MKKFIIILLCLVFLLCGVGCGQKAEPESRVKIVTSFFPAYDFARQIAGENASVTMLLPLGSESHFYEPSLSEIAKIEECDLFIYAGGQTDAWAEDILKSLGKKVNTLCMSELVEKISEKSHQGHDHEEYAFDEHVWTSPKNAQIISEKIKDALCELDPENNALYTERFRVYYQSLAKLDNEFKEIAKNAKRNTLVFADRFPFLYLTEEYGFNYKAAIKGCSSDTEPTLSAVAEIIDEINKNSIPVVFFIEFSSQSIADSICSQTGAKKLLLHSCHNLSKSDFENGETYVSLMYKNAQNIKEALY